jgi:hypothetical protein
MKRVQLSRRRGFKLPPNTVNVARPSRWGNPFIVGKHGTREQCVKLFRLMCGGLLCISVDSDCADAQQRFMKWAKANIWRLRGKDLACWCRLDGKPCHADVLLEAADQVPAGVDVLGMAFGRLRERVNEAVDREMKERGIVLGEDGLRK